MRQPLRSGFTFDPRHGRTTISLCVALVVVSVLSTVTQRTLGFGARELIYTVDSLQDLELWRLVTFPFVITDGFQLFLNALFLFLLGQWFERSYGSRELLRFFAISAVGAALLAVPLHYVLDFLPLITDVGIASGPGPVLDAMLMTIALSTPDATVMYGMVLPIRARMLVWLIVGFQVIGGLMSGAAALSITFGGLAMGYLLVTGNWRPTRLLNKLGKNRRRVRTGLYVVPPRDKTLH